MRMVEQKEKDRERKRVSSGAILMKQIPNKYVIDRMVYQHTDSV